MNRLLRTGLLLLILAVPAIPLHAEEFLETEIIIQQAADATVEKYPDSDDVLLDDYIRVTYQADGTSEMWDDTAIKILTEKGKRDNRTQTLSFNTSYGTNYFTLAEIIKPDGTVVPVDIKANSKVMADSSQMSANIYNPNSKVLNLSIPGLEIGDTLHYIAYDLTSKTVVPDTWSDYQVFEGQSPINHMTYQVIAPTERPLKKVILKDEIPGTVAYNETVSEKDGYIQYTWNIHHVPRMFDEPNMPKRYTVVQRLLVSTIETWKDLSRWYWDLCKPRLEATTPELEAKAHELVAGCTTTEEKIKAVFNFVSQDIRYMGITPEEEAPGYEPHDVCITFENRYGVCRDKAALLAAMLRIVDIEAFPVIIMAGPKKDEEVPQPFFNHAVTAALGDNGEYILMDSTDENTKDIFPSYLQNMSYLVARPEGETLRTTSVSPATDNLLHITSTGSINAFGSLNMESTLVFEGVNDTIYRGYFSKIKPEQRHRFFEGHLKRSMPTATLNTLKILPEELRDTSAPLTVHLSYSADNLLIEGEKNIMFNAPRLGSTLGYANYLIGQTGLMKRKYPLYTQITAGIVETMEIEIPGTLGTLHFPQYSAIDADTLTWNTRLSQANNTLSATNTFLLNTVEFSPEEYSQLKQQLRDIEYNLRKSIVADTSAATEANAEEADIRVLDRQTEIVLSSADSWTETQRVKTKILTYAGQKDQSEIKLYHNPAWQQVEIKNATVTLPDGTVKEISEDEINLMDASWVAGAPRYPAGRILVGNLPGVEIGSIIEYEIVSRVDGKPFFSLIETFTGHEPVDRNTLSITAPQSLPINVLNTGIDEYITNGEESVTYTWSISNAPAVKYEEALPSWWTFNPAVFVSCGQWGSYSKQVYTHLQDAATNQLNTAAQSGKIIKGITDERRQVIAIRDWVAENIRPAGPGLTDMPLEAITPADRTLADRYGNNTDRMILLYTLLKSAGFNPEFILSGGTPPVPEAADPMIEVPIRTAFRSLLLRLELKDETLYLDGTSQYAELGASGYDHKPMLELATGKTGTVRVAPGKDDRSHAIYIMNISPKGDMMLSENIFVQGIRFETFHSTYAEMTPENRRRHYLEIVSGVSQSAIATSELTTDYENYPGTLAFSVKAENYAVLDGDYLYFTLPEDSLGNLLTYRSNERTLPLAWNSYVDTLTELTITIPEGYEPAILPESYSWEAPEGAGLIDVAVEYNPDDHTIRMVQVANMRPAFIPADFYSDIIAAGRKLAHPDMHTILLKKIDQSK